MVAAALTGDQHKASDTPGRRVRRAGGAARGRGWGGRHARAAGLLALGCLAGCTTTPPPGRRHDQDHSVLCRACERGGRALRRAGDRQRDQAQGAGAQRRGDAPAGALQLFRRQRAGRDGLDQVLQAPRACTGFAERDFTLVSTDLGYKVVRDERTRARAAMSDDLYATLGVGREASQEEIKRRLPRARQGDASRPQPGQAGGRRALQAGDRRLRHPVGPRTARALRSRRDRRQRPGAAASTSIGTSPRTRRPARYYTREGFGDEEQLHDFFEGLFGGARGTAARGFRVRGRGADVSYTLPVDFLEAAKGAKKRVTMGDGRTIDLTIPPGVHDRQTLRLKGQGMPGFEGGAAGRRLRRGARPAAPLLRAQGPATSTWTCR